MSAEKIDRRAQRTRRMLTNALVELMLEKRFDAITVQEILDRADVGRSTFYAHFSSKEELLYSSVGEMIRSLPLEIAEKDGSFPHGQTASGSRHDLPSAVLPSLGLFRHVKDHQRMYRASFSSNSLELMTRSLQQQLAQIIVLNLEALLPVGHRSAVPLAIVADYVAGAFLGLLRWWMEGNDTYTPEQIDAMFKRMVLPGVMAALYGSE